MSKKRYVVLSPDGFTIHHSDTYPTLKEAHRAFEEWKKRYEFQGYYSSTNYGRILLDELKNYCQFVENKFV
jgi:hypothetical protein